MPHQCTTCERTFPDGSKEMLSGCPECGGNKFQFLPSGKVDQGAAGDADPPQTASSSSPDPAPAPAPSDDDIIEAPVESPPPGEDRAQATARSAMASSDEIVPPDPEPETVEEAEGPDLSTLREELAEQFESIKILQPGQYELNLMELYDRDEYIIALEEDGRYVIDVPTATPRDDG